MTALCFIFTKPTIVTLYSLMNAKNVQNFPHNSEDEVTKVKSGHEKRSPQRVI